MDMPISIADGVHSFLLGDELMLFSQQTGAMFRLNQSAALIWSCCEEGLNRQAIVAELVQTFNLPESAAETDVDAILTEWQLRGLLEPGGDLFGAPAETPCEASPVPAALPRLTVLRDYPLERHYRLLDSVFRLRFTTTALELIAQSVFGHLAVPEQPCFDVALDVQEVETGFVLCCDGELVDHCSSEAELGPLLHGWLLSATYSRTDCLAALHAAAVSHGDQCILMPASSGSGKSTLTAALIASGFEFCTDELVLLNRHSHTIRALPAGIGLKSGSWPVLEPYYPALFELPVFLRQDGKQVRYLLPPRHETLAHTAAFQPVHALVFPRYRPEQATELNRISPGDALCRLTEAGYDVQGGLNTEQVRELVDWMGGLDCFELNLRDLPEAISRIAALLA